MTHSKHDRANCLWHKLGEGEAAIGCVGAREPKRWIGQTVLRPSGEVYTPSDFASLIVNVNADEVYQEGGLRPEGAHSDIWYEETLHLILSLVRHMRARDRATG
jgi:hypothetical protein